MLSMGTDEMGRAPTKLSHFLGALGSWKIYREEKQLNQFLGKEGMATHASILAWRIPWTKDPGGLWSTGWQRVGHN